MAITKVWTQVKDNLLKDNWKDCSDESLSALLGVTVEGVKTRRRRLGLLRAKKVVRNKKSYTYLEVKELFEQKKYELLESKYSNYTTKMKYVCKKHKTQGCQKITLCDFLRGRGCYWCGREVTEEARRSPVEELKRLCEEKDFIYVNRYFKGQATYVEYICNKHKEIGVQHKHITNFRNSICCPHCSGSKGEMRIEKYLIAHEINYAAQKRFADCRDKKPLPFDFYLPDYNYLIEYDGQLHYMPGAYRKSRRNITKEERREMYKNYMALLRRDAIKTRYCEENGYTLIRIPYWELSNIEEILSELLLIKQ